MTTYVEQDCTVTHEGRTFEAGGAVVTPEYAIGYVKGIEQRDNEHFTFFRGGFWGHIEITDWHGNTLGHGRITHSWCVLSSSYMHQVEATINGVKYTGRTQGNGMIWKGKRMAKQ